MKRIWAVRVAITLLVFVAFGHADSDKQAGALYMLSAVLLYVGHRIDQRLEK